jgi:hypothetical protein
VIKKDVVTVKVSYASSRFLHFLKGIVKVNIINQCFKVENKYETDIVIRYETLLSITNDKINVNERKLKFE